MAPPKGMVCNPRGIGGWKKGQSGNKGRYIGELSCEARRYARLALDTLTEICRKGEERNRLVAARELLDRGFGRPIQQVDILAVKANLSKMTDDELFALQARIIDATANPVSELISSDPEGGIN